MGLFMKNGYVTPSTLTKPKSKKKPASSVAHVPPPTKGILRKPSAHFVTYDEKGNVQTDNDAFLNEAVRQNLPIGALRSTNAGPYPVMLRHSSRRTSYTPPGWHPGMKDPPTQGPVTYASVNRVPMPGRYYRFHSDKPFPHPGIKCVVRTLQFSLKKDHKRFTDYLDTPDVFDGSLWDCQDQEGLIECALGKETKFRIQQAERDWAKKQRDFHVFGGYVKAMNEKCSTPISIHGFRFRIPIVVAACVEEIYRRGMNTTDLFTKCHSRQRVLELVSAFDKLSDKGPFPDLRKESIHDVAHLLGFFISSLPLPLMHRTFFDGFSAWCVEPSLTREQECKHKIHTRQTMGTDGEYHSETDTEAEAESEEDEACVGLPSFNSRKKRLRRKQRAIERAKRRAFAQAHPDLVISNRPSHQQRRAQMYRELQHLETPQINHARLLIMLIAPHCTALLLYLFTFFSSLMDHPDNKITPKMLADKFAWKLLSGPNKEVSKELLEWLVTRWERISHGFKSEEALAWEKKRDEQKKRDEAAQNSEKDSEKTSEKKSSESKPSKEVSEKEVAEPAPQYQQRDRRGSDDSDRSAAPSYHSTEQRERSGSEASTSSSSSSRPRSRRRSSQSQTGGRRRSSADSATSSTSATTSNSTTSSSSTTSSTSATSAASDSSTSAPRLRDTQPLRAPKTRPAKVHLTNPWEGEDTPVISPFKDADGEYEAEDEKTHEKGDDDDCWDRTQRSAFAAVESLLQPKSNSSPTKPRALSYRSTTDSISVYSQDDDDLLDDIINDYSDESRRDLPLPEPSKKATVAEDEYIIAPVVPLSRKAKVTRFKIPPPKEDPAALKREFEAALHERELAQKKLEQLTEKFKNTQQR